MAGVMKVIIAGSRTISDVLLVSIAVTESKFKITEVVSGGARGIDLSGEFYAKSKNISVKRFKAHWDKHGKRAGYMRNIKMADYADALIAIWDSKSKGTEHMISIAKMNKLKVFVYEAIE